MKPYWIAAWMTLVALGFTGFNAAVALGGPPKKRERADARMYFGTAFVLLGLSLFTYFRNDAAAANAFLVLAFPAAMLGEHRWRIAQGQPGYRNRPWVSGTDHPSPRRSMMLNTKLRPQIEQSLRHQREALLETIRGLKTDLTAWELYPQGVQDPRDQLQEARSRIDAVHDAQRRLEDGSLGYCLECGQDIDPQELLLDPTRTRCNRPDCTPRPRLRDRSTSTHRR